MAQPAPSSAPRGAPSAIQCVAGSTHRRGTPPNVVEMDAETLLALAKGQIEFLEAAQTGKAVQTGIGQPAAFASGKGAALFMGDLPANQTLI